MHVSRDNTSCSVLLCLETSLPSNSSHGYYLKAATIREIWNMEIWKYDRRLRFKEIYSSTSFWLLCSMHSTTSIWLVLQHSFIPVWLYTAYQALLHLPLTTVDILFMRHSNSASKLHFPPMTISNVAASLRIEERVKQFLMLRCHSSCCIANALRFHRLCARLPCISAYLKASHRTNTVWEQDNTVESGC